MAPFLHRSPSLSRRHLLQAMVATPLLCRAESLFGSLPLPHSASIGERPLDYADIRYVPEYPAPSPLEDVLRRVPAGSDEYLTEGYAYGIGQVLAEWSRALRAGKLLPLQQSFHATLQAASLLPEQEHEIRQGGPIRTWRQQFNPALTHDASAVKQQLEHWWPAGARVLVAEFEVTSIDVLGTAPLAVRTAVRFDMVAASGGAHREQRTGTWLMEWVCGDSNPIAAPGWKLRQWQMQLEERSVLQGAGFVDVSEQAFGSVPSYRQQLRKGSDEWRTQLDGASGIDVYGNNGLCAGDYDNDGLDDLYICQPAGLPNRLYRNRGGGTFEDVTDHAGVGILDNTACALFADFRNCGLQDLLVVCGTGPLLFVNQGNGTFVKKADAFRFSRPPEGTFTSAAIADYDNDGRLDVYFCVYSYYLGLDQYHYPAPYYDARNGPPNFLFHNAGDGTFTDRTEAAGLNADNDRYSFACAWGHAVPGHAPDLYVVNDFGRNTLYRNQGDGTFRSAATRSNVEDVGAGMSAAWGDCDNSGRSDLYVADMWSAAGQRVSQQPQFHADITPAVRDLYQRHAEGNALYTNEGNGTFHSAGKRAGVQVGRWAWGSDFVDIDHDGFQDLYVTNGYITEPKAALGGNEAERGDLGSFFWRQVVGKSADDATPSQAYEHGWNALNELIRTDHSWSGSERNVLFLNNHDGTFTDVAGVTGLDCIEDSRSFVLADIDGDGRQEIILKNRSAPQLRVLRNAMALVGDSLSVRLHGTTGNRDAIGAMVTVETGDLHQTRYLQAGSGFLSQHSKELLFGLGNGSATVRVTVQWPGGSTQQFEALPRNRHVDITEGSQEPKVSTFRTTPASYAAALPADPAERARMDEGTVQTWLLDPLKAPAFSLPPLDGSTAQPRELQAELGRTVLLHFWSAAAPECLAQLQLWQHSQRQLLANNIVLLAINVDRAEELGKARAVAAGQRFSFPMLLGGEDVPGIYNLIYRYLYDRRRDLPLPCTFLLDAQGMIVKVYGGPVQPQQAIADANSIPVTQAARMARGLPFPGTLQVAQFVRNDFTYGVAMFQHGYLDQAADSFQQVVRTRPDYAEGYYNLGTLDLRRNRLPEATGYLQQALKLKPDYPEAWNNLGMIAAQQGRMDDAVQNFRQALQQRHAYATALLNLGNVYRRQGNTAEAEATLRRALALQPDDAEVNYNLGMLYAQAGSPLQAKQYLQQATTLRPNYPEAWNNLGVLAVRGQDYAAAEQAFRTSIERAPRFEGAYINLARLYVAQHQLDRARVALQDLLKVHPDNAAAQQGLRALDAMH